MRDLKRALSAKLLDAALFTAAPCSKPQNILLLERRAVVRPVGATKRLVPTNKFATDVPEIVRDIIAKMSMITTSSPMSSSASTHKHSAPGQLAGYLFQPERALYHLATKGRGSAVGIETADDVVVTTTVGATLREQDKHYTSARTPLGDRSKELWNSLFIWLNAIDAGEVDLKQTEFHLVTNKTLAAGIAHDLRHLEGKDSSQKLQAIVKRLRKAGERPASGLAGQITAVLAHSDEELAVLLARVRIVDGTQASHGSELRQKIANHLNLPADSADDVLNGLLGWIHDTTLLLIRQGKPALFTSEDFGERYRRELFAHADRKFFRETAAAEIPVTDEERAKLRQNLFVQQLLWIGLAENDEQLIDAIDSVYRSTSETIRLTKKGFVTPADFAAFDGRLVEKWNLVRRANRITSTDPGELQKLGQVILGRCMEHREKLAGQDTQEWYLTQGAFHKLADAPIPTPRIGWHPHYKDRCDKRSPA
ncbi:MAG TPA: ABC-three component system protein [Candidatus Didemnitutus sp.]|nr:ABC-three component system protein [Candidatus Didemnitutus sp.]